MIDDIKNIKQEAEESIKRAENLDDLDLAFRKYLGRESGELTKILRGLKNLPLEERSKIGTLANETKNEINAMIEEKRSGLGGQKKSGKIIDFTLPGKKIEYGHLHPLTQVRNEVTEIFHSMGFEILEGLEVETDYYNFEALNIPSWHPARDIQDTFYIESKDNLLLRTHTSPVQIRAMQKYGAPFRGVVPGRCFRNEATDASHEHTFYQMEGLMIDKDISISNLIAVMKELLAGIFKREVKVRLRPGYFPFVEPGFELDIQCLICGGKGCPVCKQNGWVEILPCGLVHPNVLKAGGIDPQKWSSFAFGLGLTRLVMMKYGIDDIRLMQSGDMRFLNQF